MKFNFQVEISLFSHLAIKLTAQQRCCVVRFIASLFVKLYRIAHHLAIGPKPYGTATIFIKKVQKQK